MDKRFGHPMQIKRIRSSALVRTGPQEPKHDGISFLLIDMDQPGVTTRPITLISGKSPFL